MLHFEKAKWRFAPLYRNGKSARPGSGKARCGARRQQHNTTCNYDVDNSNRLDDDPHDRTYCREVDPVSLDRS
ncbi:hypothetical protein RvY_16841 [Ramazzottius varieornatus]|uniref:Uncharacterized protein n=1 Tax=Ramazzottius varieornatus TaxID=947166 RepID=A0A1D1W2H6_RAMVA|nr:hypothetical protein RvY_16841 [Ramazzottius varieornatus]